MKMKHSFLFILLVVAAFVSCKSSEEDASIKPTVRDISEYVYASANIVSQDKYQCRPSNSGIIQDILIKKGDKVKKGQLLFRISATANAKNKLTNATLNLEEMKTNLYGSNSKLNSIKIEIERIEEQNSIDSVNYERRLRLWNQEIGNKSELERSLLTYQSSTSRLESLHLEYDQLKLNLDNSYERAKNQVNTERSSLGDLEVRSQIDGEVFNVLKEVGEFISPQEIFAAIGSVNSFIINMNIDEVDISKIEIGDTAIISLEAYPDKVFESTLSYISNIKDQSTQTFVAESIFTESPTKLFNGLAGEANILVARRKNARVIPSAYLTRGNRVVTEDGEIIVRTGVKNLEFVEIIEGVDTSTTLIKPDTE